MALNSNGTTLYITSYANSTLSSYNISENTLTTLTPTGVSLRRPVPLALTPLGQSSSSVNPPTNLTGQQAKNDFGLVYELVNSLTWSASTSSVSGYHVYRNGTLIASLGASTYQYIDHNIPRGVASLYYVTAFNVSGAESSSDSITIK